MTRLHPVAQTLALPKQRIPLVDVGRQTVALAEPLQQAMWDVCTRSDFILGSEVERFESAFANYLGAQEAVGVASGLDALSLTLQALEIGPGDEILVPVNSFIATALAVSKVGAKPIFVDCRVGDMSLDIEQLEDRITARCRAIIPVHLTGNPADMKSILEIADLHGLAVVEDACQAHGARIDGQRCGTFGIAGCFSFYPGKNLGAFGDGGLISTNDSALARRLRSLRHYGQTAKYNHAELGTNSRLDTIQAAILNIKLPHLDRWNRARAHHAEEYRKHLLHLESIDLPPVRLADEHAHHLFVIRTADRDGLQRRLELAGVATGVHYPVPIHLQTAYQQLGYRRGDFPVAEKLAESILSLPMFPELTSSEIDYVCQVISQWCNFEESSSRTTSACEFLPKEGAS